MHDPSAPSLDASLAAFRRGVVDLIDESELRRKLARAAEAGRPLRIKFGMDPSSADLHLGHAVQLMKLRDLQELGHTIVLIVGDATAMVGDPSGRNKLRPQLDRATVEANMRTYTEQAARVLDLERCEVRYNHEWFGPMQFEDVLRLCGRTTVARMLERDTFDTRMKSGEAIGVHELLYPLMQGWDSVVVRADVEVGATDQLFNVLFGRTLQEQEGQERQVVMTHPLIVGLDGRKMSKSYGNAIGLTDAPADMFGKIMSITDEAMPTWFTYLTRLDQSEVEGLLAGHPREAKARLAGDITEFFHGAASARSAREAFDRQFRDRQIPEEVPEVSIDWPSEGLPLAKLLLEAGLAASTSEARRVVQQGGVRLDGTVAKDPTAVVPTPAEPLLVQVGKKRFRRLSGTH